jgi:diguanylate cyclase (GGDEF)-like protein/PAS domain S-box-containing protein
VPEFSNPEVFRAVLESLQTGVYFVDREQRILFWNEGAERITGYMRHEVVGCFCRENILAQKDRARNVLSDAADSIASVLRDGRPSISDVSLRHKAGYRIFVRLRAVPIRNSHGTIIGAAESFDENPSASDWDRRQNRLAGYGCLDPATGVLNQAVVLSHLRENVATFADHPVPFSVLCIEVDQMDRICATYGVAVVSAVLRVVAQTIENSLRPTDFLGRMGERRFLAILTECGATDIEKAAERLKKMVNRSEIDWWGDQWSVTASFGATTAKVGDTVESILERAEKSLSESVAAGGNRVAIAA